MALPNSSRGSLFDKFVRVCTAPFTTTGLGQRLTDDLEDGRTGRDQEPAPHSYRRRWRDAPVGENPTSARSSMSRDAPDPVPPRYWSVSDEFRNRSEGDDEAWQRCANVVGNFDATECQVQREQIDTLLVFAGLFSGVATAFIMEGYKWMITQPDDLSVEYLRQILALLSNKEVPSVAHSSGRPELPDDIVNLINGLWFSSLTLSLSSALIGIVSKQWLREYLRDAGRAQKTNLAVRQVKYQGLKRWWVDAVITSIPLLLQAALFLFLVGVVYLLWHIQRRIALAITIIGSAITLFFIVTTIMPAGQYILCRWGWLRMHTTSQVPFKSAQAWLFLHVILFVFNSVAWVFHTLMNAGTKHDRLFVPPFPTHAAWPQFDLDWTQRRDESAQWTDEPTSVALCLGFMELNFEHPFLRKWIWGCLWSMRENVVDAKYVLQCIRRIPRVRSTFPSPDDGLAHEVLPLSDPAIAPQMTSELVLHAILEVSDSTSVEHLIRIYNSLAHRGAEVPSIVYETLRSTLEGVPAASSSTETRMQLYYVAQTILRKSQHNEVLCGAFTKLITRITTHLSQGETQENHTYVGRELSLDIAVDISDWLERYPEPINNWRDFKTRIVWSAQTASLLARRLASFKPLDVTENIAKWHPRFPSVCALIDVVFAKASLTPIETWPSWTPSEKSAMENLGQVKAALDAAREETVTTDDEAPLGAPFPAARPMPWMMGVSRQGGNSNSARPQQNEVHFNQDHEQNESSASDASMQASGSDSMGQGAQDAGQVSSTQSGTTAVEQDSEQPMDNGDSNQAAADHTSYRTAARQDSQQTAVSQDSDQTMVSYASRRTSPSPDLNRGKAGQDTTRKSFGTTRSLSLSPEGTILEQDEPPSASTVEEFSQELDDMPSRLEGDIKRRPSRETGAPEPQGNGPLPSPSDNSASRSAKAILPSRANGSEPSQGGGTPSEQIMESSTPSTGAPPTPSDARAAPQESEGRSLSSRGSEIPSPGGVGGDVPPRNGSKPRWRI
ncbi:hypothetical protein GGG16DRAFT_113244 [Schizophyllum commune]